MSRELSSNTESLESWLSKKPYWEQYVWKINYEKETLAEEDFDRCYLYLSEHLGIIEKLNEEKSAIHFRDVLGVIPGTEELGGKSKIFELKEFTNVNAIQSDCSIKFGQNLTIVYGQNGSGKSGIGRLLCDACFSRGEREILPNVREASSVDSQSKATFILENVSGDFETVEHTVGDYNESLKSFAVFDSKSVLIHLDQSNNVNFVPAQIKIFDKVADTILKLEENLESEKNAKRLDNPFQSMFIGDPPSEISDFCMKINSDTEVKDFLRLANFDGEKDEAKIAEIEKQIDNKKKLDIARKKQQLNADCQNLNALKRTLQNITEIFTEEKIRELNNLISDIAEKKSVVKGLSIQSFDDGFFKTIGSSEWKSLINTAKVLFEYEVSLGSGEKPKRCLLCHQELSRDAESLFEKYWEFLESKAEAELAVLMQKQTSLLYDLKLAKTSFPKLNPTDAGVGVLVADDPQYLEELKKRFLSLEKILSELILSIETNEGFKHDDISVPDLKKIDEISLAKNEEEKVLADPAGEIAKLSSELTLLKHKKDVFIVRDIAIRYIEYLNWFYKITNGVNFAGIKMATTKKRTEAFLENVAKDYKGVFNNELKSLGCEFDLVMKTAGDQGNTVKEYRIDVAEEYNPSQILSEGEQNVCSLADFLTEINLDKGNCGIIFDDPVTSLDHERKAKIAQRLVVESAHRQVVIFTHDLVFMSQLVRDAEKYGISFKVNWIRKINGVPGFVEEDASPKLACLAGLKTDYQDAIRDYESKGAKEQEMSLGIAFDYLRSACEALVEEVMFAKTVQRYDDHIKIQNLEEVVFDQSLALKVVELHGKISEKAFMHNVSDLQRENPPSLSDFNDLKKQFEELETAMRQAKKQAQQVREKRKKGKLAEKFV